MLKLFDSFSLKKKDFVPFQKNLVKIFICGPTLYDYTHIGHARIFLIYDLLCRLLHENGYATDVLVNMTDINQNVFKKAKENSEDYSTISRFYSYQFINDLHLLNVTSINRFAHVSDFVTNMEEQISNLMKQNIAYSANGNIYLDTSKVKDYGAMSKQSKEQLNLHRLDIGPHKKSQDDIMLWNCSEDFGFYWDSQFGKGIPWWHMQDSAVAIENFGRNYDIHGGARELSYPHHEAHFAQYKLLTASDNPVKFWTHVGLVLSNGEKMSKSLGNVVWARDVVNRYGQNLLRLYIFSAHYHKDIDFTERSLLAMKPLLEKLYLSSSKASDRTDKEMTVLIENFFNSLNDDLNSQKALEILDKICSYVINGNNLGADDFVRICRVLGIKL
ncbi:MAG: hypothetical protein E6K91_04075 [Thaumarchaeota archaeon]|nr:MAG: hypothetical protein E6K91_04075 [Nitrososphaerota archaeon]